MEAIVFRLGDNASDILREVCMERGWMEYCEDSAEDDSDWNLWWKSQGFTAVEFEQCRPWHRLNHFPKSSNITKKDGLARNLRRMRTSYGGSIFDFFPVTFILPNEYKKFVAEFSKEEDRERNFWICKPTEQSCGRGIFIFQELHDLTYDCGVVVQKYIVKPLLISGYKFDLRLYVIVTSFHPFRLYVYHEGLVRFSTEKFDLSSLNNPYSHLTNTSINKKGPQYSVEKESIGCGCKWTLSQLRVYLDKHNIDDRLLWHQITSIIIITILSQVQEVPAGCFNCFELFGFDILVDEKLKPWLLEVNFSPALGNDCTQDVLVKKPLLNDILSFLDFTEDDIKRGKKEKENPGRSKTKVLDRMINQPSWLKKELACKPTAFQANKKEMNFESVSKLSGETIANSSTSKVKQTASTDLKENGRRKTSVGKESNGHDHNKESNKKKHSAVEHLSGSRGNKVHHNGFVASEEFLKAATKNSTSSLPGEAVEKTDFHESKPPMNCSTKRAQYPKTESKCVGTSFENEENSAMRSQQAECDGRKSLRQKHPKPANSQFVRSQTLSSVYSPRTGKKSRISHSCLRHYYSEGSLMNTLGNTAWLSKGDLPQVVSSHSSFRLPRRRGRVEKSSLPKLQAQVGNCILVFPFNDVTYKASQGRLEHKIVVEEIRKIMKASRSHVKASPREESEDDLTTPFWGYRSAVNTFYSSIQ